MNEEPLIKLGVASEETKGGGYGDECEIEGFPHVYRVRGC